ncbi:MAG: PEP-CTERM sorting domain-containing protein [Acidobacteria bacterium]|nr:PEP-CTERM sorting domain-containing protein [Acidobacteriota bacterium]
MMKKTALSISVFVLAALVLVPLASADTISLTLTNPVQTASPGSTVSFDATVTAIYDKLGPAYLNGDSSGITGSLTVNDTPFLVNFPLVMSAGDSVTNLLFTVALPSGLAPGMYTGYFSILGGLNSSALGTLDTAEFTINASTVPEPATWALIGTGMAALLLAGFTRRRTAFSDAA